MSSAAHKLESWSGASLQPVSGPSQEPRRTLSTELEQALSAATVASAPAFLQRSLLELERQIAALRTEQRRLIAGARLSAEPPPPSLVRRKAELPTLRPVAPVAPGELPSPAADHRREAITRDALPRPTLSPPTCRPAPQRADGRYSVVPIGEQVSVRRTR